MHILNFLITYIYKGCKKKYMCTTEMDLDLLNHSEIEGYITRNNLFVFDAILTWNYIEIVGVIDGSKKEKKKPTLKYGKKKSDEALEPRPAPIKKASE